MTAENTDTQALQQPHFYTVPEEHGIDLTELDTVKGATWARQEAFLAVYADCGTIREAAAAVGVSRQTVYNWRDNDVLGFQKRIALAFDDYKDWLLSEGRNRLRDPKGNRGSDTLLIANYNAYFEEFRPKQNQDSVGAARDILFMLTQLAGKADGGDVLDGVDYREVGDAKLPADLEMMRSDSED